MNFFIKTFGCQMNVNDSEKMRHILEHRGLTWCADDMAADIVIINGCAVRAKSQDKVFSYAGRLPAATRVVVAGCVGQAEREAILKKYPRIDYVVGTHQYYDLGAVIDEITTAGGRKVRAGFSRRWTDLIPDPAMRESTVTAYISIMEGCDNFCSYCIVPFTRGREKYRPARAVIAEAERVAVAGFQEIVLLGQNVNHWREEATGWDFADLLDRLAGAVHVPWIRFITSYPGYHDDRLLAVMEKHRAIARHIHFPAQSGSTRILRRMNRVYRRDDYLRIVERFRRRLPGMAFSSDFIVGFPGETEHDFRLTLSLLRAVQYESVFSFVYSRRKHTKAAEYRDEVPLAVKKARLQELQRVQAEIQLANNRSLIGRTLPVLVSEIHPRKPQERIGRSETYRVVNFVSATPVGRFTTVRIESAGPHSLRGVEIHP